MQHRMPGRQLRKHRDLMTLLGIKSFPRSRISERPQISRDFTLPGNRRDSGGCPLRVHSAPGEGDPGHGRRGSTGAVSGAVSLPQFPCIPHLPAAFRSCLGEYGSQGCPESPPRPQPPASVRRGCLCAPRPGALSWRGTEREGGQGEERRCRQTEAVLQAPGAGR